MVNKHTEALIGLLNKDIVGPKVNSKFTGSEAKYLIDNGADVNADMGDHNKTPLLSKAIFKNRYGMVKLLLENKANPNAQDRSGMTPLHYTVDVDSVAIAKLLLEKGANIGITDDRLSNALSYYYDTDAKIYEGELEKVLSEAYEKYEENSSNLINKILYSKDSEEEILKSVDKFLNNGADFNYSDAFNNTPISSAIDKNYHKIALYLINKGANLETGHNPFSLLNPLIQAIRKAEDKKMVEIIIQHTSKETMTEEYRKRLIQIVKDDTKFDIEYSKKDVDGIIKVIQETKYLEHSIEVFNEKKSGIKKANEGKRIRGFKK